MRTILIICDLCGKEIESKEFAVYSGVVMKVNTEMEKIPIAFEIHICPSHSEGVYEFISNIKIDGKNEQKPRKSDT